MDGWRQRYNRQTRVLSVSEQTREAIDRAAELEGMTSGEWVRITLRREARRVVAEKGGEG